MASISSKKIVFDMDGVLLDSERLILNIWILLGEKHHVTGMEDVMKECLGTNNTETRRIVESHFGPDFPYEEFRAEAREMFFDRTKKDGVPLKAGSRELLQFLKINGWDIGLASSTSGNTVREELQTVGLLDFFKVVVSGEMVRESKPHPEIYFKACEMLGSDPKETIAIEDSKNGVRSAAMAGCRVIMVPDIVPPDPDSERLAWKVFPDLGEVRRYFTAM
ncbi:MAG: HAD family phosphatase [Eubacterium sp.]|nr:HAD family phosphatase [Eubacterium sp.]